MNKTTETADISAPVQRDQKVLCPAGTYWVGDPCYACSDEDWDAYCATSDQIGRGLVQAPSGAWIVEFFTMWGDGEYLDQDGRSYPVDAGVLGVVPQEYASCDDPFGMHKVTFDEPFLVHATKKGVIHIGPIAIATDDGEVLDW